MTQWNANPAGRPSYTGRIAIAAAAALAMIASVPTAARATLIDYVFTDNGGFTGFTDLPVSITGEFTYDTVTMALTAVDVTVSSDPNGYVFDGTYTQLSGSFAIPPDELQFVGPDSNPIGGLSFKVEESLGTIGRVDLNPNFAPSWIAGPPVSGYDGFSFADAANPPYLTGTVEGSAPIPEPDSLLLLGAGCGLIVLRRHALKQRSSTASILNQGNYQ